ncbi:MAG TPA: Asp-tRNA(Asn)/Glu-tRNA(Gln) amidotransferase subunit GatA [Actinomycetota bacterium]|nr:Asp-tRNA(Asn)/Glu-tRNA(Gln) amidotransferase subunit GatA [Actinomycetota bacterium]
MTELADLSAHELGGLLRAREVSAAQVLESSLRRVKAVEPRVRAFLLLTEEVARTQAEAVDRALAEGRDLPPPAGIPLAVKDVLTTRGIRTTAGSRILEPYVPPYDCTPWARLKEQGSVLVGKTNCDEFAMGSSNENSAFGPVYNPWDLERVPGGSSGGSAAAVAAGEVVWALGTDTGGSVRQPAALCGVVGLKPTYGRISRYGLIAFASSLDHVGTFTRTVRDAALLLSAVAGHDPLDATSLPDPPRDYGAALERGVEGLRVGLLEGWLAAEGIQPAVREAVREAARRLAGLGAVVEEAELPHAAFALSAYYILAPAECSSNLARYDGVRYGYRWEGARDVVEMNMRTRGAGFGDEVKRRIMLGTYALSAGYYEAYYGQAQKVRTLVIRDYERAFERFDLLVGPTSPTTAFRIGEKAQDPLAMYLSDIFTIPANLAGVPAISIPCGLDEQGLPIGVQLMGRLQDEETVLRGAFALEQELAFSARPPLLEELAA